MKTIIVIFALIISCGKMKTVTKTSSSSQTQDIINEAPSDHNKSDTDGLTGEDIQGQLRTCIDQSATMTCTMVFTPSDSYANECRSNGFKAVMCACHDWICVK